MKIAVGPNMTLGITTSDTRQPIAVYKTRDAATPNSKENNPINAEHPPAARAQASCLQARISKTIPKTE
jgi:hypothetical protein